MAEPPSPSPPPSSRVLYCGSSSSRSWPFLCWPASTPGQRITSLCADLQTFHKTRKQPKGPIETFAGKTLRPEDYVEIPIDTEDFGVEMFERVGQ